MKKKTQIDALTHNPTPYRLNYSHPEFPGQIVIENDLSRIIAVLDNNDDYDRRTAEFIVRAVNSHEALLWAAKQAHRLFNDVVSPAEEEKAIERISKAIAQAEGE